MLLNASSNMQLFLTSVETGYGLAYTVTEKWHPKIARVVPISNESVVNGWVDMLDRPREWIGPRQVRTPAPQTYLVTPKPFELTWGVDRFRLDDDRLNWSLYVDTARQHGELDAKVPDYELRDLIFNLGSSWTGAQTGTDGATHWNTAHSVDVYDAGKGTYCNDFRSGGVSVNSVLVGGALSPNAFKTLYAEQSKRPMTNGEAGQTTPDLLVASTLLKGEADVILKNQFIAPSQFGNIGTGAVGTANGPLVGMMDNPTRGWVDYLILEDFAVNSSSQLLWLMLRTKGVVKPFTMFLRQGAVRVQRTAEDDPAVFDSHTYLFGSWQRLAPAWGLPFLSSISGP